MAQSTNDAYPTALRLAVILATRAAWSERSTTSPTRSRTKAVEFADVLKMGRTQLQDAVPMTLGQEFDAFHATLKEDVARLGEIVGPVPRGEPGRHRDRHRHQRRPALRGARGRGAGAASRGQPMVLATNLIEATSDMGAFVLFSGLLKRIAVKLSKICNDLRLLSSGPAHRLRRDPPAGGAGRLLDHARAR